MKKIGFIPRSLLLLILCSVCDSIAALSSDNEPLRWRTASSPAAMCNDFTQAGFFHRNTTENGAGKWIVFLESGALCYSSETCNRRYFKSSIRAQYSEDERKNSGYGDFEPAAAFSAVGRKISDRVVNPLMTSMRCFNNTEYFPWGLELQGTDFFDRTTSHVFRDHGHVVVPYCSSDVWLGSENNKTRKFSQKSGNSDEPCNCFDQSCFRYDPNADGLQFTFRGKTIFQSVLRDLDTMYNLQNATEIILIGSSAGGVGAMNLARWVTEEFPTPNVMVISDSAWFINFRDGINKQFTDLQKADKSSSTMSLSSTNRVSSTSHMITSSPMATSHMMRSSTIISSTTRNFVIPSTTQSIPSANFATPTPTPDTVGSSGSGGFGNGGDGMFFGSGVQEAAMMTREENDRSAELDDDDWKTSSDDDLISLLESSHDACQDTRRGYPCCLSAQCLLSTNSSTTNEPYFPKNVRHFAVTSLYDAFILSQALLDVQVYLADKDDNQIGLAVEYLTVVGEYGGVMDNSLMQVQEAGYINFSFYVSQCFQHIYFATSTLWGEGRVFGTDPVQIDPNIGTFRHSIRSGVWNTARLASGNYTIMDAINMWYRNGSSGMTFRDDCRTPHCNEECPEQFIFDPLQPNVWPVYVRIAITMVVVAIAVICILLKVCFYLWLRWLEHKQSVYLQSITQHEDDDLPPISGYIEEGLKREFPICTGDQAISVACLDLHYSVSIRVGKQLKDEKKENFTPIVLSDLRPEDELNGSEVDAQEEPVESDNLLSGRKRTSSTSSGAFQRIKNALIPHTTGTYHIPTFRPDNENIDETIHRTLTNGNAPSAVTPSPHGRCSRQSDISQDTYEEVPLKESRTDDICSGVMKTVFRTKRKKILKGMSVYFNPGEMIGIMGPSGCGKTTFLDLLTGRRKSGNFSGQIYINGVLMEENHDWYISNTGYVVQLARPYYEELTVRENLTLAAWIRLTYTAREKFQRVEQVMDVSGLLDLAETVVGGATGPGLSGGQKRRLAVALQLLKLPSVIFLDEPTSGLDAASSRELLAHLNELAASNRTVVLTIHQPRLEIFHMFDRLVLLSDGKVAYHGVPDKAYEVFVNALRSRYLQQNLIIPDLEDRNPADVIMDMLGNQKMRQLITDYYQCTDEPKLVNLAVKKARLRERKYSQDLMDGGSDDGDKSLSMWEQLKFVLKGARKAENTQNHLLARLATLEARATKRSTLFALLYLPIIFFVYGILLGTVYLQQDQPFLIMSGFCVYSVASALFMFPALYTYYQKALEIYSFEHADSAGRAYDLVVQPFIRFITMAILPVVACALILYVLLVHYTRWSWTVFGQLVVVNIALNQAWVAILICLILTFPRSAIRLSPPLASIMGFTSGFFIPVSEIPWWYRWLTLINPNYYGFSASAFLLLEDFETSCDRSGDTTELECYPQSSEYILKRFDFDEINPYYNITLLLVMTVLYLLLSVFSNWWNHVTLNRGMKKVRLIASRLRRAASTDTGSLFSASIYNDTSDDDLVSYGDDLDEREDFLASNEPEEEEEEEEGEATLGPLSPIAEKQEESELERESVAGHYGHPEVAKSHHHGNRAWERSDKYPLNRQEALFHPTSLPEIPTTVSPNPPVSPQDKARDHWRMVGDAVGNHRSNSIELDTFVAQSEPPTPEKHVVFRDGFGRRPTSRLHSVGEESRGRQRRRSMTRSVYLRDGAIHSVWKPPKNSSAPSPKTPTPPPSNFADVVHEVMRQNKLNLRERQRQLFSRVTATQAVLKEANEELAAVRELTEEEEEEDEKEGTGEKTGGGIEYKDAQGKKMWQQAFKTIMDEKKKNSDVAEKKNQKRIRKRSTIHFHEVVTNKLASMDCPGAGGLPSISEQGEGRQLPQLPSPQRARRKMSLPHRRVDAATPSGAIPFTEWKNQFHERQRLTRKGGIKHFKSDYNLKAQATKQHSIPRMSSENDLSLPTHRRSTISSPTDFEPRSKSVAQYRDRRVRRSSSPEILAYGDHGEMSDTSVALDDMLSPLSSRSVSPAVFSDEEERSKVRSKMPQPTTPYHVPLVKLDSEETRLLSRPSNMRKRKHNHVHYRPMFQPPVHSGNDIIDQSDHRMGVQSQNQKQRPKRVSLSVPSSPRGVPSFRPTTPQSNLPSPPRGVPLPRPTTPQSNLPDSLRGVPSPRPTTPQSNLPDSPRGVPSPRPTTPQSNLPSLSHGAAVGHRKVRRESVLHSPTSLNDRISQKQSKISRMPEAPYHRATTPEGGFNRNRRKHPSLRRSSTPDILNPVSPQTPTILGGREISTLSPPPLSPFPDRSGGHHHTPLHVPENTYGLQTTV